jgi:hypothetical protein
MKPFFIEIPNLGKQFEQIHFGVIFPNSWGNTSFYKLENKTNPSKII